MRTTLEIAKCALVEAKQKDEQLEHDIIFSNWKEIYDTASGDRVSQEADEKVSREYG